MARKKLAMVLVSVAVALVLVNVIFGYIVTGTTDTDRRRCMYSLYRVGVALVEYCNVHDTTLTPPGLQTLVDEGIMDARWLRCSEMGSRFGYFGQFDILGPRPPVVLWCASGHVSVVRGRIIKTNLALDARMSVYSYTSGYFEQEVKTLEIVREIIESGDSQEDVDRLLGFAQFGKDLYVRLNAIWMLGKMRSERFENVFLQILKQDVDELVKKLDSEKLKDRIVAQTELDIRFEAAVALALLGNPAGGAALLLYLRDPDYFKRLRAFNALKELTGDDFGFKPVLEAESQPAALDKFDKWWARTVQAMREKEPRPEKQ